MSVTGPGWTELAGGAGTVLAVRGPVRVAAQSGRLWVWHESAAVGCAQVPTANPARPVILPDGQIRWGPYEIDAETAGVTELPWADVPAGYRQTAHTWSADGQRAVVVGRRIERTDDPGVPGAGAWVRTAEDAQPEPLWTGPDLAPEAVAAGPDFLAIGGLLIADGTGHELASMSAVQRLDVRGDRLLVVTAGRLAVWATAQVEPLGEAGGGWLDACLSADGTEVFAVTLPGRLLRLRVPDTPGVLPEIAEMPVPARATGLATDGRTLLAAFGDLPALRAGNLTALT